jgi:hypothetical protein
MAATRLGICQPTDFWYSSMRADDKCPAVRPQQSPQKNLLNFDQLSFTSDKRRSHACSIVSVTHRHSVALQLAA